MPPTLMGMVTLNLGAAPTPMGLILVEGADFVCTLERTTARGAAEDWPESAQVQIRVAGQTWTAAVDGASARFDVDRTAVDAVIAARAHTFRLTYTDGPSELVWGQGTVQIIRRGSDT